MGSILEKILDELEETNYRLGNLEEGSNEAVWCAVRLDLIREKFLLEEEGGWKT